MPPWLHYVSLCCHPAGWSILHDIRCNEFRELLIFGNDQSFWRYQWSCVTNWHKRVTNLANGNDSPFAKLDYHIFLVMQQPPGKVERPRLGNSLIFRSRFLGAVPGPCGFSFLEIKPASETGERWWRLWRWKHRIWCDNCGSTTLIFSSIHAAFLQWRSKCGDQAEMYGRLYSEYQWVWKGVHSMVNCLI